MSLNTKKLAEQFSELSALMEAISGTFRDGGGSGEGEEGDGKAGKAVRGTKSAAKRGAKAKEEVTEDSIRDKLKQLAALKGKDKMLEVLEAITGQSKLADVDEDDYEDLDEAITKALEEEDEKPAGKTAKGKKAKAPTKDEVVEAFGELNKKQQRAVLKELELDDIDDLDEDDEGAVQDAMTAVKEAAE